MDMNIAIDLVWVKHNQMGGVESYVRNLLSGFVQLSETIHYTLLVSSDNKKSFSNYKNYRNFTIIECPTISTNLFMTTIWENLYLDKIVTSLDVDFCFVPYYRCPILSIKNKYVIVLHDLNALHFPEYFSKGKYLWLKYYWKYCLKKAYRIITISEFCKKDIMLHYKINEKKIDVIYNPITKFMPIMDFDILKQKYNISEKKYLYTISSTFKHKNLMTILKAMNIINKSGYNIKLLISGVNGGGKDEIVKYIKEKRLENICILTGFVVDEERNSLIKNAKMFLFPSLFEGFGMPPIEAMRLGTRVITTKCASIPEVTQNKAIYVNNPIDEEEWVNVIMQRYGTFIPEEFECYNPYNVAFQYLSLFKKINETH